MTTTSPTRLDGSVAPGDPGPRRVRLAAAALAASSATVAVLLATTPWGDRLNSGADKILTYEKLRDVRDAAWPAMLLDSFALAVIGLTLGLAVLHLTRARGRIAALIGAALSTAGGILFAMGGTAFATLAWFITANGLPPGAGQSLVDYANRHPGHLIGLNMAGFLLITIGALVLSAALIRARAVPVPMVITYIVLTLAQFTGLPGRTMDFLQLAMMLLLIGFAAVIWRRA
ncbi:hypothetical protein SAMN04488543_1947 [Friedmanniella luteola]|uniref:DUF4386 family protein n=1 Tax=Friedmanniella luteola TaxID=546871 RepID=A0A1H1T4Y5_9ACTN|nr:hypothetical protein [Friedmanniella luteola]SDS55285.1 hypothetical protein SAMN04488543_1947 [Friedmanniella luteola]